MGDGHTIKGGAGPGQRRLQPIPGAETAKGSRLHETSAICVDRSCLQLLVENTRASGSSRLSGKSAGQANGDKVVETDLDHVPHRSACFVFPRCDFEELWTVLVEEQKELD